MKLLRDMKNEHCFSQVFSKQEFLLCQAVQMKEICFSRLDSGCFFAFFDLWAWISGESLNYG